MSIPAPAPSRQRNVVPLPYRQVSVQPYSGLMTEAALRAHLLGREAYRRTNFIVLHRGDVARSEIAVIAIAREDDDRLFSPITDVEVLALPDTCVFA
jgi:hypothetical protein